MLHYILNIKRRHNSFSSFCIDLRPTAEWPEKFDDNCDVIEHRHVWNKCFIICQTDAGNSIEACRNTSQAVN